MTFWQKLWSGPSTEGAASYLVVGLGNPGHKYEGTRHNAGFAAVRQFAENEGFDSWKNSTKYEAEIAEGEVGGGQVTLLLPQTFMNLSGRSVKKFLRYAPGAKLIVVHDELDLPLGTIKISQSRGPGGHNGVTSIINELGTADFVRLRLGLGRGGPAMNELVLGSFRFEEREIMEKSYEKAAAAIKSILISGVEAAMGEYNQKK